MKVVDADILIDFSRRRKEATDFINSQPTLLLKISITTKFELFEGARNKKELRSIEEFFSHYDEISPSPESLSRSLELFKAYNLSHGIDAFDSLLAGVALMYDATLVTRNRKHYDFIPNLKLEIPY